VDWINLEFWTGCVNISFSRRTVCS
jgi:hypothetical protein